MEVSTTYEVTVSHGERYWLVEVPAIGHVTQARNLAEVEPMARDLIAVMLEVEPGSIQLTTTIELPETVTTHLARSAHLREEAGRVQSQAAQEVRLAARALRDSGLTVRDIGRALDVSYQRAHQLIA